MEHLLVSFKVVFPLIVTISVGMLLKKLKLLSDKTVSEMNSVIFKVFFPILLFNNVYDSDLSFKEFNFKLTAYCLGGVVLLLLISTPVIMLLNKENPKRASLIQGIFRSNLLLFGLPIVNTLYPAVSGSSVLIIALTIPLYNFLAVLVLELFRGEKIHFGKLLLQIIKNPLIIGATLGLIIKATGLTFPDFLESCVSSLAKVATPLSLILLGASLSFGKIKSDVGPICIGVVGKLIIAPLLFVTVAALIGFRGQDLALIMAVFAVPTAVSSYTMAVEMGADGDLAGELVVFNSLLSILTLFLWVFSLSSLNLL